MFIPARTAATFVPFVKVLGHKEIQKTVVQLLLVTLLLEEPGKFICTSPGHSVSTIERKAIKVRTQSPNTTHQFDVKTRQVYSCHTRMSKQTEYYETYTLCFFTSSFIFISEGPGNPQYPTGSCSSLPHRLICVSQQNCSPEALSFCASFPHTLWPCQLCYPTVHALRCSKQQPTAGTH